MVKRYLFDTGVLTAYLGAKPGADQLQALISRREVTTSFMVYGEAVEHYRGQPDFPSSYRKLRRLMATLSPIGLTYPILDRYAALRREMRRPYGSGLIGDIDTLIAATALDRDLTVITTDRDFMRVPKLNVVLILPEALKTPAQ